MKEHPISFSAEMVRAILDGRKTQTRRIINDNCLQSIPFDEISPVMNTPPHLRNGEWVYELQSKVDETEYFKLKPIYQVGDRLWVREAYRVCNMDHDRQQALMVYYCADRSYKSMALTDAEMKLWKARKKLFTKTPGRFMYKSLARIFLKITGLRVERVQDISPADCEKEGLMITKHPNLSQGKYFRILKDFESLWDSINSKRGYGWDKNPWVWVIEFKKLELKDGTYES